MPVDPRFIRGLELFNQRDFYECHEIIEELWLETKPDPHSALYKGVIQAAGALYQWERGYLGGAYRLFLSSVNYLGPYGAGALGLNVEELVKDMRVCFRALEEPDRKGGPNLSAASMPTLKYQSP